MLYDSGVTDSRFWESYQSIDQALLRFRSSLPPLRATALSQYFIDDDESRDTQDLGGILPPPEEEAAASPGWFSFVLLYAHVCATSSIIELHGIFADRDEREAMVVLTAAREIATIIRNIGTSQSDDSGTSRTGVPHLSSFNPRRIHRTVAVCD